MKFVFVTMHINAPPMDVHSFCSILLQNS